MSDLSSKPITKEEVTMESNEKPHAHIPTLAELAEKRKAADVLEASQKPQDGRLPLAAVLQPEPLNARPSPLQVDPTQVLTSVEVISMELHDRGDQPYVLESSSFETLLNTRRNVALRLMQDLDVDIERLQAEINQRLARRNDLSLVVARADAALGLDISVKDYKRT
jgi:hypothetical protein